MRITREELRQGIKRRESEPHCWASSDDHDACMESDGHAGDCVFVGDERLIISLADLGTALTVRVRP